MPEPSALTAVCSPCYSPIRSRHWSLSLTIQLGIWVIQDLGPRLITAHFRAYESGGHSLPPHTHTQKAHILLLTGCRHCLEVLNNFWTKGLYLILYLCPINYVAGHLFLSNLLSHGVPCCCQTWRPEARPCKQQLLCWKLSIPNGNTFLFRLWSQLMCVT